MLPPLPSVTFTTELKAMRQRLIRLSEPPDRPRLTKDDWLASLGVFGLVFAATFLVALPSSMLTNPRGRVFRSLGVQASAPVRFHWRGLAPIAPAQASMKWR